ncbi:MAG: hypothetical protein PHU25_20100 [Deltaproteobacteria bacterium]|nr:hypothetical protein [Deltaproteobacteria bacterium]
MFDMLAALLGFLPVLAVDPWCATVAGLPLAAALVVVRRTWWRASRIAGRIAVAALVPLLALVLSLAGVFGANGVSLGFLLAAALLAVAEGSNRRSSRTLLSRFPLATAILLAGLGTVLSTLLVNLRVTGCPTEEFLKDLAAPPDPERWSRPAEEQAIAAVRETLSREAVGDAPAAALHRELASRMAELARAPHGNGVFVTVHDRDGLRARGMGRGGADAIDDVIRAAGAALAEGPRKARSTEVHPRAWPLMADDLRIEVSVPGPARRVGMRPMFRVARLFAGADKVLRGLDPLPEILNLSYAVEPGVDGLLLRAGGQREVAAMLPDEPVTEGWLTPRVEGNPAALGQMLRRTWARAWSDDRALVRGDFQASVFRAASFASLGASHEAVQLYRANTLAPQRLERGRLVDGIVQASDWLARQVRQGGRFHYEIFPPYRGETKDYNLPRHAGAIYGLFAMSRAARTEPAFAESGDLALEAGLEALEYVKGSLGSPDPEAPELLCFLDGKGDTESGSTALAAVSLTELPEPASITDPKVKARVEAVPIDPWLRRMGDCLLAMVDSHGRVFRSYKEAKRLKVVKREPLYFPGEVMLGLVKIFERVGDGRYVEAARRIGDAQMGDFYWPLKFGLPRTPDHWVMQALAVLARVTGEKRYAELSVLMGYAFIKEQFPPQAYSYPDYRGAYRRFADVPRTTRAASRGEALGGSMDAAHLIGADASAFEDSLIEGARHLLEQQFTDENSFFVPADYDVEGAIRMGLIDNHCRIDNNQHALVGLMRALEAMDAKAKGR